MTRRSLVALISASVLLAIILVAAIAVLMTTQTDFGRERIRNLVLARASLAIGTRGKLFIGKISGSLFTEIVVDSLSLRDAEDSLVIATGPLRLTFDPRDFFDQRIHLHKVDIARPTINLRRHANDMWNYQTLFPPAKKSKIHTPGFGDYIVADSVTLHDGTFMLTEMWQPDDSLKGARRDSAVKFALARAWPEVRVTKEGLKRTRRWTQLNIDAPRARIAMPDSAGQVITLASLSTVENDPPTEVHNIRGTVRIHGDSVWLNLSNVELPHTHARDLVARIWWGGNKPVQLDLHAVSDTLALADFAWVYAGLPRTGGGRTDITVKNDPKDLRVLEYALHGLDLRTANSHLRGDLTVGVGGPVLIVKNVAMRLEPADFDLLRTFNGGTFPVDFRGQFTGSLWAPGGPINRWRVDSASLTYTDAHVPGAVSHLDASGELDLLVPSLTKFRGFDVNLNALDLRTVSYLFPNFPRLGGTITGSATLDSVWTNVRFSDADIEHHDGPEEPTHMTGSGRVTSTGPSVRFNVTLQASPISFSELARSYPSMPLRGTMSGPLRVQGTTNGLALTTNLTGDAGTLVVDEMIDIDTAGGEGARGTVRAAGLDLAQLLDRPSVPTTQLYAQVTNDLHGDALATMFGTIDLTVDTSRVKSIRVPHATARAHVADGHVIVDSLTLTSTGVRALGSGMLGLAPGAHDTLRFTADIDSLGGLRPFIAPGGGEGDTVSMSAAELLARARRDSLNGTFSVAGFLAGSAADSFTASATFLGEHLVRGADMATRLAGGFDVGGLPKSPAGTLWMRLDSARIAGVGIDTIHLQLVMRGLDSGAVTLSLATVRPAGTMHGGALVNYAIAPDTLRFTLDTLRLVTGGAGGHTWRLLRPAHYAHYKDGDLLDSLVLSGGPGGRLAIHADLPATGAISALLTADSVSLGDLGQMAQVRSPLGGYLAAELRVSGTRDDPVMHLTSRFRDAKYGTIVLPYFSLNADYAKRVLVSRADFFDKSQTIATLALSLPADLALHAVPERFPDEPLTGRLRADSVDMAVFASMSPFISQPTGIANVDLTMSGTRSDPQFTGFFRLHNAAVGLPRFGVRLTALQAAVNVAPGEIKIDTLSMKSGSASGNFMSLTGTLRTPDLWDLVDDRSALVLDLHMVAHSFQILNSRKIARVEVTDDVTLTGKFSATTLRGHISVDNADFYVADLAGKKTVVDLDDPELFADPAVAATRNLGSSIPPDVRDALANLQVDNLDVVLGDKVWLRSDVAEIKLGGAVVITGSGTRSLNGKIFVQHGTYRLDLGIVQRTFTVDSGSVRFYGDVEKGGLLNVWASSTVRQANRQGEDVKILAHITGTTNDPRPEFSSGERYALSEPEILSYLIFGQPSFVQGTNSAGSTATSVLLPSVGTAIERALSGQLHWVDQITIQSGATTAQSDQYSAIFGSRLGVGKQLGDKTYVAANAGLCFLSGSQSSATSFSQSLGLSVEQRLGDKYVLQASREPASASMQCKPGTTDIGSRPAQYGIDLFREWTF